MRSIAWAVMVVLAWSVPALGQEPVSLIDPGKPAGGWQFGDGPEFPGAKGTLALAKESFRGQPVLSLHGDFTDGGNYVQAWVALPKATVHTLSFWVNVPAGSKRLPIRYTDAKDQVHQINLRINEKGGWQHLVLPIADFFKTMGTPGALDIVVGYETWGGAKDREKHNKRDQPVPNLAILASRAMETTKGTLLISQALFHPSAEAATAVVKTIRLDEMLQAGELDWQFNLGQEFPGAKGGLDLVADQPEKGKHAMRLHADFTGGGAYVGVRKSFAQLDVQATKNIRLRMRSETTASYALRLVDDTGQCHQRKTMSLQADGKWHDVTLDPAQIAGGEHWGGANDGKWHGTVRLIELMLNVRSHKGKKPDLSITDIRADVVVAATVKPAAFTERFEADGPMAPGWKTAGDVGLDGPGHDGTKKALRLRRTLDTLQTPTWATSPVFAAGAGTWQVKYAWQAKLHSPDNSYHGSVVLDVLSRAGGVVETIPVGIGYGTKGWQPTAASVELPRGASKARFRIELKKTYGSFRLDELSAAPLSVQAIERRVERILISTSAVGNLFLPGDEVTFRVAVEAAKPLPAAQRTLRYSVRDYWGAEQIEPGGVPLQKAPRKQGKFVYHAAIAVPPAALTTGKYCELHVEVPEDGGGVQEFSGFAVLPPAIARKYAPERVPFTIRNWDSRIPVYFHLADRLGLRLMGMWGGWSPKAPYKPHCPGIDLCKKLGAKWITGTPASSVERKGFAEYSEEALRQGMHNFLEKYATQGLAMIAMGNEPHGTGRKVLDNVRAYKAIYETVKAHDPNIHVIGTSVEPNEEYFKAGYQNYLDSYDFHVYEHYTSVRRTIREYRALMKKYGAVKPIHSTELGLNSQGQTRHAVALELIKKFTVFFAEAGSTVSWFTIQYPDPKGKARGQFGDAHCVFDCKYNLYSPRLDAVVHYNMINGICVKKFVEEKHYPNGVQAYLFRDDEGNCLQVLWIDEKRAAAAVPLPAGQQVQLVRLDGSRATLQSTAGGVTLTLSAEPALLLYRDAKTGLATALGTPAMRLAAAPPAAQRGETVQFVIEGKGLAADQLQASAPPRWKIAIEQAGANQVKATAHAPRVTPAREARIYIQLRSEGNVTGELTVPVQVARTRSAEAN
ncbi:MAG: hypothetical protein ISS72_07765 [Candidatus Brocadiae bacterium]|nr:hypothetical protein [Candidatus Brocadiia bacterium]